MSQNADQIISVYDDSVATTPFASFSVAVHVSMPYRKDDLYAIPYHLKEDPHLAIDVETYTRRLNWLTAATTNNKSHIQNIHLIPSGSKYFSETVDTLSFLVDTVQSRYGIRWTYDGELNRLMQIVCDKKSLESAEGNLVRVQFSWTRIGLRDDGDIALMNKFRLMLREAGCDMADTDTSDEIDPFL